jgi:hypothetical protein
MAATAPIARTWVYRNCCFSQKSSKGRAIMFRICQFLQPIHWWAQRLYAPGHNPLTTPMNQKLEKLEDFHSFQIYPGMIEAAPESVIG